MGCSLAKVFSAGFLECLGAFLSISIVSRQIARPLVLGFSGRLLKSSSNNEHFITALMSKILCSSSLGSVSLCFFSKSTSAWVKTGRPSGESSKPIQ